MVFCYVHGCVSRRQRLNEHIFKLPRNASDEIRQQWLTNIPGTASMPFDYTRHRICSKHFEQKYLISSDNVVLPDGSVYGNKRIHWGLAKDAVPTLFFDESVASNDMKKNEMKKMYKKSKTSRRRKGKKSIPQTNRYHKDIPPAPYSSASPKRGYCCLICLKIWYENFPQEIYQERENQYTAFIHVVTRYLQIRSSNRISEGSLWKPSEVPNTISGSVCLSCCEASERICDHFKNLNIIRLKLDYEILKLVAVFQDSSYTSKQKCVDKVKVGMRSWKTILSFNQSLKIRGSKLPLYPKVHIPRLDEKSSRKSSYFDPLKNILKQDENANPDIAFGTLEILKVIRRTLCCSLCGKSFFSDEELSAHEKFFHVSIADCSSYSGAHAFTMTKDKDASTLQTDSLVDCYSDLNISRNAILENIDFDDQFSNTGDVDGVSDEGDNIISAADNTGSNNTSEAAQNICTLKISQARELSAPSLVLNDNVLPPAPKCTEIGIESSTNDISTDGSSGQLLPHNDNCAAKSGPEGCLAQKENFEKVIPVSPNCDNNIDPEIKEESDNVKSTSKIPFMSSEYLGKYRALCKLKNIHTGETLVGVVGKTNQSITKSAPKVLSVERVKPRKKRQRMKINGPPFICPIPDCAKYYDNIKTCRMHYRKHLKILKDQTEPKDRLTEKKNTDLLKTSDVEIEINGLFDVNNSSKIIKKGKKMKYRCELEGCASRFYLKESLDCHMKSHSDHGCKFCSQLFKRPGELLSHEMEHHQESTGVDFKDCSCPRCEVVTLNPRSLKKHFFKVHLEILKKPTQTLKHECKDCDRIFFSIYKYIDHRKDYHGEIIELPVSCPNCTKKFANDSALKIHLRSHNLKRFELQCTICPRKFQLKYKLEQHLRSHARKVMEVSQKIQCKGLVKESCSISPYICEICGKSFKRIGTLWNHTRLHEGSSGAKIRCPVCNKLMSRRDRLKVHMLMHSGEKPFICHVCGESFRIKISLNAHIKKTHRP